MTARTDPEVAQRAGGGAPGRAHPLDDRRRRVPAPCASSSASRSLARALRHDSGPSRPIRSRPSRSRRGPSAAKDEVAKADTLDAARRSPRAGRRRSDRRRRSRCGGHAGAGGVTPRRRGVAARRAPGRRAGAPATRSPRSGPRHGRAGRGRRPGRRGRVARRPRRFRRAGPTSRTDRSSPRPAEGEIPRDVGPQADEGLSRAPPLGGRGPRARADVVAGVRVVDGSVAARERRRRRRLPAAARRASRLGRRSPMAASAAARARGRPNAGQPLGRSRRRAGRAATG